MSKRKRQEAILSLISRHQIATQEELVERLVRVGIETTQATVSRDIAELGLVRLGGPDTHYVKPNEGLGAASPAGRPILEETAMQDRSWRGGLKRLLRRSKVPEVSAWKNEKYLRGDLATVDASPFLS
jgi:hypothetical protein